jgi:hypothetical protein
MGMDLTLSGGLYEISIHLIRRKDFTGMALTSYSYISDLTPEYILALVVTATYCQVSVLRDAIYRHRSFSPSIQINVLVS